VNWMLDTNIASMPKKRKSAFVSNMPLVYANGDWPMKTLTHEGETFTYVKTVAEKHSGVVHCYEYQGPIHTLTLLAW